MLRIGLTGGLGSGKSAVAMVWADAGVPVLDADALGRTLMEPGQTVYQQIVETFGPAVLSADASLDRAALARIAFVDGRLDRLNRIVHPAVIEAQAQAFSRLEAEGQAPLAAVESAILFEASGAGGQAATVPGWRERFDRIVVVVAPEADRIARFIHRVAGPAPSAQEQARLAEDARRRIAAQLPDAWKRAHADYVIENNRTLVLLRRQALSVLQALRQEAATAPAREGRRAGAQGYGPKRP